MTPLRASVLVAALVGGAPGALAEVEKGRRCEAIDEVDHVDRDGIGFTVSSMRAFVTDGGSMVVCRVLVQNHGALEGWPSGSGAKGGASSIRPRSGRPHLS